MAGFLDGQKIDIPCPSCGHKNSKTIGWLKTHKEITCGGCRKTIKLDSADFVREIKSVEKTVSDFSRKFGKL